MSSSLKARPGREEKWKCDEWWSDVFKLMGILNEEWWRKQRTISDETIIRLPCNNKESSSVHFVTVCPESASCCASRLLTMAEHLFIFLLICLVCPGIVPRCLSRVLTGLGTDRTQGDRSVSHSFSYGFPATTSFPSWRQFICENIMPFSFRYSNYSNWNWQNAFLYNPIAPNCGNVGNYAN